MSLAKYSSTELHELPGIQMSDADVKRLDRVRVPNRYGALAEILREKILAGEFAAALLAKTANPTDADIDEAMRNNICRCGTYQSIRRAVHLAAELRAKGGAK